MLKLLFVIATLLGCYYLVNATTYQPNWDSLDTRPLPAWYDDGKFGIFIHWGVFSVPAFGAGGSEWFWYYWQGMKVPGWIKYMEDNYRPGFTYGDFGPMFKAEFYDPNQWAQIFKSSGAKYIVLVAKHHEGFDNWPSNYSFNWNSMDIGPKRDLVGDLGDAIRKNTDIKFGIYHSMFEFFNPLFLRDQANHFKTQDYVRTKTLPELYELVNRYKPDVLWSDGEWMAPDTYWNSTNFIAWVYNESPVKDTIVVNDRWGSNTRCKHGGFWNCKDHYHPGKLVPHKWESCLQIDKSSWGYRRDAQISNFRTIEELLQEFATTVSLGGNFLLNIGPTAIGTISPIFEERLLQIGSWLDVNGEAIYNTTYWSHHNDSNTAADVRYTVSKPNAAKPAVYAIMLKWPANNTLKLSDPVATANTEITMLGYPTPLKYQATQGGGITVTIPPIPYNELPCKWAWALKITGLQNQKTKLNPESFAKMLQSISMMSNDPLTLLHK